ncbi:MAG: formate dehydrogenase subunit delta [Sphingomonadales bacterium]|nr:formate dehydrogenase subunit delta [Sphingomonadales bacterium]MDE2568824.1 formate dehydrogenase subunit delta [Sphingomonadales bacterium]
MSATTPERLTYMANQIAANMGHEPDPAAAVAKHIASFWTPAMRVRLFETGLAGLSPLARAAMEKLGAVQAPDAG